MSLGHYIFIRRDLPVGVALAMVTHAAGESGACYRNPDDGRFRGATAIVLGANSEDHLHEIRQKLTKYDIPRVDIIESGGPYDKQFMAIGVVPIGRGLVADVFKEYEVMSSLIPLDKATAGG